MEEEDKKDLIFLDTDHVSIISTVFMQSLFMNKKMYSGDL